MAQLYSSSIQGNEINKSEERCDDQNEGETQQLKQEIVTLKEKIQELEERKERELTELRKNKDEEIRKLKESIRSKDELAQKMEQELQSLKKQTKQMFLLDREKKNAQEQVRKLALDRQRYNKDAEDVVERGSFGSTSEESDEDDQTDSDDGVKDTGDSKKVVLSTSNGTLKKEIPFSFEQTSKKTNEMLKAIECKIETWNKIRKEFLQTMSVTYTEQTLQDIRSVLGKRQNFKLNYTLEMDGIDEQISALQAQIQWECKALVREVQHQQRLLHDLVDSDTPTINLNWFNTFILVSLLTLCYRFIIIRS
eukprot:TRINITY_DN1781_c0_g1_i12.p1 TRINITY_DN1781_c0_g1~~TRINITY_DN1781_c0_g1_i12.p1  ORF type:complete len:309 (-),score=80.49 TRINITY_DN1781_c0_g1_i12:159-1085(-)